MKAFRFIMFILFTLFAIASAEQITKHPLDLLGFGICVFGAMWSAVDPKNFDN